MKSFVRCKDFKTSFVLITGFYGTRGDFKLLAGSVYGQRGFFVTFERLRFSLPFRFVAFRYRRLWHSGSHSWAELIGRRWRGCFCSKRNGNVELVHDGIPKVEAGGVSEV